MLHGVILESVAVCLGHFTDVFDRENVACAFGAVTTL